MVLWTVPHANEQNFLVAYRSPDNTAVVATNKYGRQADGPGQCSIPIQYQITNIVQWLYGNASPNDLLSTLATAEVVRYLAGSDLNDVLSQGRLTAAAALKERIQSAANPAAGRQNPVCGLAGHPSALRQGRGQIV